VDAFAFEWVGEMAYMAPPVSLVSRCISKIVITRMSGLLLIQLWRSAKFWSRWTSFGLSVWVNVVSGCSHDLLGPFGS
jgi:hypothetical protein